MTSPQSLKRHDHIANASNLKQLLTTFQTLHRQDGYNSAMRPGTVIIHYYWEGKVEQDMISIHGYPSNCSLILRWGVNNAPIVRTNRVMQPHTCPVYTPIFTSGTAFRKLSQTFHTSPECT